MRVYQLRLRQLWRRWSIDITTLASVVWCALATAPAIHAQGTIDTTDRATVAAFYDSVLVPALAIPPDWTGSVATCVPGTTSAAYAAATVDAVNFFRAMTGLPAVAHDPSLDTAAQAAALISSANNVLTHVPTAGMACYTDLGRTGASRSNLSLGTSGAQAVLGYIDDAGASNIAVGHRRWILYPMLGRVGTGSTNNANALYVLGNNVARPPNPSVVTWPSAGFVPSTLVYPRWSFALNTTASVDFSSVSVTMTRGGVSIPLSVLPDYEGYGDDTLVWHPELTFTPGSPDQVIDVRLRHILVNGQPKTCAYTVVAFDPAVSGAATIADALPSCTDDTTPLPDPDTGTEPDLDPGGGTVRWLPDTSGSWHVGSNWSTGVPPGPDDDVVVHRPGVKLTVTITSPVTVRSLQSAESLSIAHTLSVTDHADLYGRVVMSAGAMTGPGVATIHGTMRWIGGSMTGAGETVVAPGATLTIDAPSYPADMLLSISERTLTNRGTLVWRGGYIQYANGASVHNTATGLWLVDGRRSSMDVGAGVPARVTNAGILQKTGEPSGVYFASLTFFNTGTIRLRRGAGTHDYVSSGNAVIGGALEVSYIDGYSPPPGEGFLAVACSGASGTFTSVTSPTRLVPSYWAQGVTLFRGDSCGVALSSSSATAPASGALQSVGLTASGQSCSWMAASNQPWLWPTQGSGNPGSATLGYVVHPNPTTSPRTAVLTVDGQTLTVTQAAGACAATLSNDQASAPSFGSMESVGVTTSTTGCDWTATSNQSWLTPQAAGGTGSATLLYAVQPNPMTVARFGTLTVAGRTLIVRQAAATAPPATCGLTIWPTSTAFVSASTTWGQANVIASSESCAWAASSNASWLVPQTTNHTGSRFITYQVQANPATSPRTGTITIGDQILTVHQPGQAATSPPPPPPPPPCTLTLSPSSTTLPVASATRGWAGVVTSSPSCVWTATSNAAWLTPETTNHTGSLLLAYQVQANPTASPRTGTITIGGQTLTVTQPGQAAAGEVFTRYLAEGVTSAFFDTRIALLNPGTTSADTTLTFLRGAAAPISHSLSIPAGRRVTIDPKTIPGLQAAEFSTEVQSSQPLVVDRTTTWDGTGYGSHSETGVSAPSPVWYFAEGATIGGFQLFYLLQNPSTHDVPVKVRYLRTTGAPLEKTYMVPAQSRFNVWANGEEFGGLGKALANAEFSAVVEALDATPIIVERAMYLNTQGRTFNAGHESAGVTEPKTTWFLAEGATGQFFDLFVLIANPTHTDAQVKLTYLLTGGQTLTRTMIAPANARSGVWVDMETFDGIAGHPLANVAVSTTVESLNEVPLVVERAMWWPGDSSTWHEAHNSAGATTTGRKWAVAEGEVGGPHQQETYLLIANTSDHAGSARVTLYFEDGTSVWQLYPLDPRSRTNVNAAADFGDVVKGRRFGAVVESLGAEPAQIVVERAMYSNAGGVGWAAGTNALATKLQ